MRLPCGRYLLAALAIFGLGCAWRFFPSTGFIIVGNYTNNITMEKPSIPTYSWIQINNQSWELRINNTLFGESFDRETTLKKLAGQNIVIIGDSLSRYQYLNLVYFLTTGSWVSPFPSNEDESQWGRKTATEPALNYTETWRRFYYDVSKRLATSTTYELCDCQRVKLPKGKFIIQEGRYFRDVKHHINIDYIFENRGVTPAVGNYLSAIEPPVGCDPGKGECQQRLCEPGRCFPPVNGWNSSNAGKHDLNALVKHVLFMNNRSYKYDIVLLADDRWTPYSVKEAADAFEIVKSAGIKTVIWKPAIPRQVELKRHCNNSIVEDTKAYNIAQQGWNLVNVTPLLCLYLNTTNHTAARVFYDDVHMHPNFNTAANYLLLDTLGFL